MIPKSTRATAERCIPFPSIKERTSFTIKPHRSARVRPTSPRQNACYIQRGGLCSIILLKNNQKSPDNACETYEPLAKRTPEEVSPASAETHNDTRGAYGPRRRRVLQKELASYPRGTR